MAPCLGMDRRQGEAMSQAKERPILFSGPMVRALLDGRKTVTRRPIKPSMRGFDVSFELHQQDDGSWRPMHTFDESCMDDQGTEHPIVCPYGQVGDLLWVRESGIYGQLLCPDDPTQPGTFRHDVPRTPEYGEWWIQKTLAPGASYNVKGNPRRVKKEKGEKAVPSIHMPRWACRILLEVTDVRVERLQDGEGETDSESRYVAEGIHRIHHGDGEHYYHPFKSEPGPGNWADPFDAWRELWVSINGADSWNTNPWVWVVEFKRVQP